LITLANTLTLPNSNSDNFLHVLLKEYTIYIRTQIKNYNFLIFVKMPKCSNKKTIISN